MKQKELLELGSEIVGTEGLTLGHFWQWAYSDLLNNVNRSVLAEFIVSSALWRINQPRIEWDAVDIHYGDAKIEVKSSAYLQSWEQRQRSKIRFDIAKKKSWYSETNTYSEYPIRSSDIYVFCLFAEQNPDEANVLNLAQWEFYVVPTTAINDKMGESKSISLVGIKELAEAISFRYIKAEIDKLVQ